MRTVVCHGQDSSLVQLDREGLVAEDFSVDRPAAVPGPGQYVPSLHPSVSYHAVEGAPLVVEPFCFRTCRAWDKVSVNPLS